MTRRPALALLLTLPMAEACAGPAAAATSGVVLYSDREWGRLYVHDGERVRAVPAVGLASFPDPHRRVEVDGPVVRDLGPAEPPAAAPLEKAPADGLLWVAAEAWCARCAPKSNDTSCASTRGRAPSTSS
jgi:hypothetical protein